MALHRRGKYGVRVARWIRLLVLGTALAIPGPRDAHAQQDATAVPQGQSPQASALSRRLLSHVPIMLDGRMVFEAQAYLDGRSPDEVASSIERRLTVIAGDPFYSPDLLTIRREGTKAVVYYRDDVVGVIGQDQAAAMGQTAEDVAGYIVQSTKLAIEGYRARRAPAATTKAVSEMAAATAVLIACLVGLRWGGRRSSRRVLARLQGGKGLKMGTVVLAPDRVAALQLRWLKRARWFMAAVLVIAYVLVAFGVYPMTAGYVYSLIDYLVEPLRMLWGATLLHVSDFAFILVMVVLTRYLLKFLKWLFDAATAGTVVLPGVMPEWAPMLFKVVRFAAVAIAVVIVYPYIPGSSTDAFKGIGIITGALFTLGATGIAGNALGGLVLMLSGTFRLGDRIRIGEVTGDVVATTFVLTRLRTIKNEIVSLPNGAVMSTGVVNYSAKARDGGLILHTEVTIGYDAPWRTVHQLLIDAALRTEHILAEPAPFVLQTSLNDYHISYQINAYTRDANVMQDTYGALHQNIQDAFNAGGIEILSPAYYSLRDGNTLTIPASYPARQAPPKRFEVRVERSGPERSGGTGASGATGL